MPFDSQRIPNNSPLYSVSQATRRRDLKLLHHLRSFWNSTLTYLGTLRNLMLMPHGFGCGAFQEAGAQRIARRCSARNLAR